MAWGARKGQGPRGPGDTGDKGPLALRTSVSRKPHRCQRKDKDHKVLQMETVGSRGHSCVVTRAVGNQGPPLSPLFPTPSSALPLTTGLRPASCRLLCAAGSGALCRPSAPPGDVLPARLRRVFVLGDGVVPDLALAAGRTSLSLGPAASLIQPRCLRRGQHPVPAAPLQALQVSAVPWAPTGAAELHGAVRCFGLLRRLQGLLAGWLHARPGAAGGRIQLAGLHHLRGSFGSRHPPPAGLIAAAAGETGPVLLAGRCRGRFRRCRGCLRVHRRVGAWWRMLCRRENGRGSAWVPATPAASPPSRPRQRPAGPPTLLAPNPLPPHGAGGGSCTQPLAKRDFRLFTAGQPRRHAPTILGGLAGGWGGLSRALLHPIGDTAASRWGQLCVRPHGLHPPVACTPILCAPPGAFVHPGLSAPLVHPSHMHPKTSPTRVTPAPAPSPGPRPAGAPSPPRDQFLPDAVTAAPPAPSG